MIQKTIWWPSSEGQGIDAYIPIADVDHRTEFFSSEAFTYDAERDVYVCPAEKELHYDRAHSDFPFASLSGICERLQSLSPQGAVYDKYTRT